MDKETLSHYGWIVVLILILSVMLALATPFGGFVAKGFKATYTGFDFVGKKALEQVDTDNTTGEPSTPTNPTDPSTPTGGEESNPTGGGSEPSNPTGEPSNPSTTEPTEYTGTLTEIWSRTYKNLLPAGDNLGTGIVRYNKVITIDVYFVETEKQITDIQKFNEKATEEKITHIKMRGTLEITYTAKFTSSDGTTTLKIEQPGESTLTQNEASKTGYTYILN